MATLEIPNLPDEVYRQIAEHARLRGRTVSQLAAELIAQALATDEQAEAKLLEEIRAEREALARRGVFITDEDIRRGREWGRQ